MFEHLLATVDFSIGPDVLESADTLLLLLVEIAVILAAAKSAGHVALKLGQPAILGELVAGVALGALSQFLLPGQLHDLYVLSTGSDSHLAVLGELGILLLLFHVGLESTPRDLLGVGTTALGVAVGGVVLPLSMGFVVSSLFVSASSGATGGWEMHLFVGAAMAATSVGVTASVLSEMKRLRSRESRIILGAAIIDDVLGLLLLAIITGVIVSANGESERSLVAIIVSVALSATIFIVVGTIVGTWFARRYLLFLAKMKGTGTQAAGLLVFCLLFSAAAELAGLAPIVGAFLAGLVIDEKPDSSNGDSDNVADAGLSEYDLASVTSVLAPVFFVLMGMQVRLDAIFSMDMAFYTAAITAVAFVGKFVVGFAVPGSFASKAFVGAGMVPRGEVGLIFAAVGRTVGAIDEQTFSALVFMVIITTLVAPPLLKRFERGLPN